MLFSVGKSLRLTVRAIWFAVELLFFFAAFTWLVLRHRSKPPQAVRSRWLQWCARRSLRVFSVQTTFRGALPQSGLLVSNHLSYLDIPVLSSLAPAVFVSKSEVKSWPVFGWCAQLGGTLFVDRTRRSDVSRMNSEIQSTLDGGGILVLFPEGTSSDGRSVMPFKSSLLEPVVVSKLPLTVSHIRYTVEEGSSENDVCYWGEMTFFPHLLRLMKTKSICAHVNFSAVSEPAADRKELARQLQAEVLRLKSTWIPCGVSCGSI